ncbi:MAG: hypothetical protein ACOZQL_10605 [Myxococcota bacterium]
MADAKDFFVQDAAGAPLLGAAGAFNVIARDLSGTPRTAPAVVELGEGSYRFIPTEDDEAVGTVVHVDCGAGALRRRFTFACFRADNSNQFWGLHVENPDGTQWSGAPPTVGSYRSSTGPRTPPAVVAVAGAYLFVLVPSAADIAADTEIRVDGPAGSAQPSWSGSTKPIVGATSASISSFNFVITPDAGATGAELAGATALRDFALDTSGDLALVEGDFVPLAGAAAVASDLEAALRTWAGEWFLDTSLGLSRDILGAKFNRGRIEDLFRGKIRSRPGVGTITSLAARLDGRTLIVQFRVTTDFAAVIEATLTERF